jgi:hypothetical protein
MAQQAEEEQLIRRMKELEQQIALADLKKKEKEDVMKCDVIQEVWVPRHFPELTDMFSNYVQSLIGRKHI